MAISTIGQNGLNAPLSLTLPVVATTMGVGGATPSATGAGITFPATQSASSDANTLDDYEEGTWTPVLQFGGANVGITYSVQGGAYTKIGNLVTLNCRIGLSNKGSSTGNARITGLPFTPTASSYQAILPGGWWWSSYTNSSAWAINCRTDNGGAFIEPRGYDTGNEVAITNSYFGNNTSFALNISYQI